MTDIVALGKIKLKTRKGKKSTKAHRVTIPKCSNGTKLFHTLLCALP
jgi:hypothetical protein